MAGDPFDRRPDVVHGVAEAVAPGVRRVTAPNASPMTFTGTRTYLLGAREVAVIDPGPDDPRHVEAVLAAIPEAGRLAAILVAHTHRDHSPAAAALKAATGAPSWGYGPHGAGMSAAMRALAASGVDLGGGEGADPTFIPDRTLREGDAVAGEGWRLVARETPGHLSNHLSFALEGTGIVFTGDWVMGWSTTLVSPPEGDMAAFMASLEAATAWEDRLFLPGHGHTVTDPAAMIRHQLAHRRSREAAVLAGLAEGPADAAALARGIYAGLDPALLPAARRNVFAHLLALAAEGRVAARGAPSVEAVFAPSGPGSA